MSWLRSKNPPKEVLNICIVGSRFPVGRKSDESFLWPVARGLVRRGHKVTALSWQNSYGKEYVESERFRSFFLGHRPRVKRYQFESLVLEKFQELHAKEPFDVIHSLDGTGYSIGKMKKKFGITMTYDAAATHMSELFSILAMSRETVASLIQTFIALIYKFIVTYWSFDRRILSTADGIFVTTPLQRITLDRYYLFPEARTFNVPYARELFDMNPREKNDELRLKLKLPPHGKNIVTVTDMTDMNEILTLLRAFQLTVIKKPNTRLIVIGNGPLYRDIEFEVLNLALGSKTIFTGPVASEDLADYLSLCDIFVNLSSRTSGLESGELIAMSLGKIVIGSELSPLSTVIDDTIDGYLLRPASLDDLSDLMTHILSEPDMAKEMGDRARAKVAQTFDSERMVDNLVNAYKKVIEMSGRTPKRPIQILRSTDPSNAATL